jgi:cytochrome c oxidase subunit II
LGRGSRIVRLHPGIVTNLELTFLRPGDHLLYCTVHCGMGHDLMHAKITVA